MYRVQTLKELCQAVLRYVGNGYIDYKITHIPKEKAHKTTQILKKISEAYETGISQGKRQYKRKTGIANYQAINFKNIIIILRTSGNHCDRENEFKKIDRKGLKLVISEFLTLILFKDERDIWTYRLSKENYHFFSGEIQKAFDKRSGSKYHSLRKMFNNLPNYVGIGKQKQELNKLIKKLQKDKAIYSWGLF